jgi:hypothetical protein
MMFSLGPQAPDKRDMGCSDLTGVPNSDYLGLVDSAPPPHSARVPSASIHSAVSYEAPAGTGGTAGNSGPSLPPRAHSLVLITSVSEDLHAAVTRATCVFGDKKAHA